MFGFILDWVRRRKIRKDKSHVPTGFLPLEAVSNVDVVIDVEEPGFDTLKEDILSWGRANRLKVNIFFLDLRKLGKDELLLTSIQTTIIRKDLNWYGAPSPEKAALLSQSSGELFISMVDNGDFLIDYLSNCSGARFKIGRHPYDGHPFDLVVTGDGGEELKAELKSDSRTIWKAITDFLTKIK